MANITITPDMVARILAKASKYYKEGHERNDHLSDVRACKVGKIFVNQTGDYCIYTGIDGNSRARPVRYTRIHDGAAFKAPRPLLQKIAASKL